MPAFSTSRDVVDAVNSSALFGWASQHPDLDIAPAALAACQAISDRVDTEVEQLQSLFDAGSLAVEIEASGRNRQRHAVTANVASFEVADEAASLLAGHGFERWSSWTGGAAESFRRFARELTVARTTDFSFVVRFAWGTSGPVSTLGRLTTPTEGDWAMISLPRPLWWGYSLVRPVRHVLERLGRRDPHESGLGPFLATPASLFGPLFELVELGPDDVLADIGCGDGQLIEAAARMSGCRSIGIEHDDQLARQGRERIAAAGLDDRVTLVHGDARQTDLSDVTVAFMFLPMPTVASILSSTIEQLRPGARLIVHEQSPLPTTTPVAPSTSTAVIGTDAVTVAHMWTRSGH